MINKKIREEKAYKDDLTVTWNPHSVYLHLRLMVRENIYKMQYLPICFFLHVVINKIESKLIHPQYAPKKDMNSKI